MVKKHEDKRHGGALRLRLLPEHDALIRQAAELAGISLSAWMRERLIRAARQELGEAPGKPQGRR